MDDYVMSKDEAYDKAYLTVLKETQIPSRIIEDYWMEYQEIINPITGKNYDYIPIHLPIEKKLTHLMKTNPDNITVLGTSYTFSRQRFYKKPQFQAEIYTYYRQLGYDCKLLRTRTGWLLRIYVQKLD